MPPQANHESGTFDVGHGLRILTGTIDTNTESVIAEVIDNPINNAFNTRAENIEVEFNGTRWETFAIAIFDDGGGFKSESQLRKSFDVIDAGERESGSLGKFHIGMKVTPLSICDEVSVYTKIEGAILHRRISKPMIEGEGEWVTTVDETEHSFKSRIRERLLNSNWDTAVILSHFRRNPYRGKLNTSTTKKFAEHTQAYLGMVYHDFMLANEESGREGISIKIRFNNTEKLTVKPLDPFWRAFTPSEIKRRLELPIGDPDGIPEGRVAMECAVEWGTIATERTPVDIVVDSGPHPGKHRVWVSCYMVPRIEVRTRIPSRYKKNVIYAGPQGAGTQTLRAEKMSGFYFYRNNRCIAFGDTGTNSKQGWYDYKDTVQNQWHPVRFKVEFPEELDEYLSLSPNKDKVVPPSAFFDRILVGIKNSVHEPLLRGNLGNGQREFYNPDRQSQSLSNVSVTGKHRLLDANCEHCKGFHWRHTTCPSAPCEICGKECEPGKCLHVCKICGTMGSHVDKSCPDRPVAGSVSPGISPETPTNPSRTSSKSKITFHEGKNPAVFLELFQDDPEAKVKIREAMSFLQIDVDSLLEGVSKGERDQ